MKEALKLIALSTIILGLLANCQTQEELSDDFTGNEVSYTLNSGSDWDFHGTATFKEKRDLTTQVIIELEGTEGDQNFPVHLHFDSYNMEADLAAQLEPLSANKGLSVTEIKLLADESPITFADLLKFDGHIKVHLAETGPLKDVILSYGNIGSNAPLPLDMKVARCYGY
jgi:hypothetical protein